MRSRHLQFRIEYLQHEKLTASAQSAAVTLFAVVTAALLPQLAYQYLLQMGTLTSEPLVLKYLPHVSYAISLVYFVNAFVGNLLRARQIRLLERELAVAQFQDDDCDCGHDHMADESTGVSSVSDMASALAATGKTRAPRRKTARRGSK